MLCFRMLQTRGKESIVDSPFAFYINLLWGNTQTCKLKRNSRKETARKLNQSWIKCFPLQIDVLECMGKRLESREIKLRWNPTFCYSNVKSYLAKWYHSWSTKQTCLLGGRVQRRNWIRWLQWEQQNFTLSAKWFRLLFTFLHLPLFIHHWVERKLDLQIWCLQWNCCKHYIIVPRKSLWTRGIWQLSADIRFVKQQQNFRVIYVRGEVVDREGITWLT